MTLFEALVALNMVSEIGGVRLEKLLNFFKKPEDIFKADPDILVSASGITLNSAVRIRSFKINDLDKEISLARGKGLKILTHYGPGYPQSLNNIASPPIVLYVKGDIIEEDKLGIAIVGSRRASLYGLTSAFSFAQRLSLYGITIVSGMARGVDTYAHRGALKNNGRSIAVMGSGFNNIYPPENLDLAEEISANGAVVSEFSLNTLPKRENFPRRNRIISGLSLGTLVTEAARNSGALITAGFALEQGKEVFALPGKIDSENSFGTNELIKDGAKLVSCTEEIIEELKVPLLNNKRCLGTEDDSVKEVRGHKEKEVLSLLSDMPVNLDEILEKTEIDRSTIFKILLELEINGCIRELPGKQFVKG